MRKGAAVTPRAGPLLWGPRAPSSQAHSESLLLLLLLLVLVLSLHSAQRAALGTAQSLQHT